MDAPQCGAVVGPGEGRRVPLGPNRLVVKVGPEHGGRLLAVFESVLPPGAGAFVHAHRAYEEAFYVLEGEIEYRLGEERIAAGAGTSVFVPAGAVHGFKNLGHRDARHLVTVAPAIALEMIEALGQARPEDVAAVLARYDSEFIGPY